MTDTAPHPATPEALSAEAGLEAAYLQLRDRRWTVLTGAGCSTVSGIPDYRGPVSRLKPRNPIQHREFVARPEIRARYWSRSLVGWPRFDAFRPNAAHHALAELEQSGQVHGLITQNVDRLHQKAGSARVIELHGALAGLRCLACGDVSDRHAFQTRLLELNPAFEAFTVELAPDGDADIPDALVDGFRVPPCLRCDGVLKPDVVFFGDNVPAPRVEASFAQVDAAEALVVVGSSLTVFSGYRFVAHAEKQGKTVVIINQGETRGDPHAHLRIDACAATFLPQLAERLVS